MLGLHLKCEQNVSNGNRSSKSHLIPQCSHYVITCFQSPSPPVISVHSTGSHPPLRLLLDQWTHSHISVSSDDPITDTTEILVLRNEKKILQTENMDLRLKVQCLQGCLEAMLYVLVYLGFSPYYLQISRDTYTKVIDGINKNVSETRKDMSRMVNHFLTKFVGEPIPGVQAASIALNPVQDDH